MLATKINYIHVSVCNNQFWLKLIADRFFSDALDTSHYYPDRHLLLPISHEKYKITLLTLYVLVCFPIYFKLKLPTLFLLQMKETTQSVYQIINNSGLMLAHRLRRRPEIKPASCQCLVFSGEVPLTSSHDLLSDSDKHGVRSLIMDEICGTKILSILCLKKH